MSRRYKIASDPSKATVCLICGCLFMGDPEDHCAKTDHKLFVRDQTLFTLFGSSAINMVKGVFLYLAVYGILLPSYFLFIALQ